MIALPLFGQFDQEGRNETVYVGSMRYAIPKHLSTFPSLKSVGSSRKLFIRLAVFRRIAVHYYSLLVDAISLFFVLYTYVQVERGKFARGEGAAWALVWVLVGVFATYPSLFSSITSALGVTLPINLIYGVFTLFL
ncbi:MAG: DUF2304 domain-containing protein, partial [Candidatus Marsarchaeota archaeon]